MFSCGFGERFKRVEGGMIMLIDFPFRALTAKDSLFFIRKISFSGIWIPKSHISAKRAEKDNGGRVANNHNAAFLMV